jgi:hypothetical protein
VFPVRYEHIDLHTQDVDIIATDFTEPADANFAPRFVLCRVTQVSRTLQGEAGKVGGGEALRLLRPVEAAPYAVTCRRSRKAPVSRPGWAGPQYGHHLGETFCKRNVAMFWDMEPCSPYVRRFGVTYESQSIQARNRRVAGGQPSRHSCACIY